MRDLIEIVVKVIAAAVWIAAIPLLLIVAAQAAHDAWHVVKRG